MPYYLTTAELAKRLKWSSKALNNALDAAGLQKWGQSHNGSQRFYLTPRGSECAMLNVNAKGKLEIKWDVEKTGKIIDIP